MEYLIVNSHLSTEYLLNYGMNGAFIETGTFLGDTVRLALALDCFDKIYSVELNEELYKNAKNMFKDANIVEIIHGDSVDSLEYILNKIDKPSTFWLDAHASGPLSGGKSGGSPVVDELRLIEKHYIKTHTIFIDDRRLFGSAEWSGVQESEALEIIKKINPNYNILYLDGEIDKDVLCATVR